MHHWPPFQAKSRFYRECMPVAFDMPHLLQRRFFVLLIVQCNCEPSAIPIIGVIHRISIGVHSFAGSLLRVRIAPPPEGPELQLNSN